MNANNSISGNNPLIPVLSVEEKFYPEKIFAWIMTIPKLLMVVFMTSLTIYFKIYAGMIIVVLILAGAAYRYFLIRSNKYYLTGQQLIIERGVFSKQVNYLELYRVKDIVVTQNLFLKIFGLMTVTVLSFDTTEEMLVIKGIKVSGIAQKIRNHVQECRYNNKVLSVDSYAANQF